MKRHAHDDPSDSRASRPVIWTLSVSRLSRLLHDVTPEFDTLAQIENIHLGFEEAVTAVRGRLHREHCDVLVAAGSNGAYLKHRIDRPVVLIRPDGFDLMQALAQAHRVSPHIGLLTHAAEVPAFSEFQERFGLHIRQRAFVTAEDARAHVHALVAEGCRVIVGTGMAADLAEQAGATGILLYSAGTIRQAFESALELARVAGRNEPPPAVPRRTSGHRYAPADLIGDSAALQGLRASLERYATSERTVLIRGATGTGKELVAQALHAASPRRRQAFVPVNCAAIAESLLESELFGYEEGAFTGARRGGRVGLIETAHRGTLFLDEIGEMPPHLQTRLLRVLEEREVLRVGAARPQPVDLRVIAATHADLEKRVHDRRFRADLYYRLNVLRLDLPALAGRAGDIALLAAHFLRAARGGAAGHFEAPALRALQHHAWPGNVRELRNLMERLAVFMPPGQNAVDAELLRACAPELFDAAPANAPAGLPSPPPRNRRRRPDDGEIHDALRRSGGDRGQAARLLGLSRTTLWRRLATLERSAAQPPSGERPDTAPR